MCFSFSSHCIRQSSLFQTVKSFASLYCAASSLNMVSVKILVNSKMRKAREFRKNVMQQSGKFTLAL